MKLDYLNDLAMWEVDLMRTAYGFAPLCDCPQDPHHRWNCTLTPVWAQTMRDLNVNPWTVIKPFEMARPRWAPFEWAGERGTYCGRGPCCLGQDHDGRCRM
jgi:hypothetical protein